MTPCYLLPQRMHKSHELQKRAADFQNGAIVRGQHCAETALQGGEE